MQNHAFQALINLVTFDQRVFLYRRTISQLSKDLQELQNKKKAISERLEEAKSKVTHAQKEVHAYELGMKELDGDERTKKKQLENLQNYKEFQLIKGELESIQEKQQEQEKSVLAAWKQLELAQESFGALQPTIEQEQIDVDRAIEQKMHELTVNENECSELVQNRSALEVDVPAVWLEKYVAMREKVVNPVVPVESASCSACYYALTNQDVLQVKQGALLQCKGCYRLLFMQ